jgi:shikimate dehydrogenase
VLGAGGGSRAVVFGLVRAGFQRVIVFNRHLHRGEALVKFFGRSAAHMELRAMPWHESVLEAELSKAKVLVNATSVGLLPGETPIPGELIPPDLLVLDLIYNPAQTRLMREAEAAGFLVMNGEGMLLHQGAAAFELWTGTAAPLDLMREKLDEAIAAGAGDPAADGAVAGAVAAGD